MKLIEKNTTVAELTKMTEKMFGNLVKAVVDIEKEIMVIDGELHSDEEKILLEQGSKQEFLWGINLYPSLYNSDQFIEFDSMINLRPKQNNLSRDVEDKEIQSKIRDVVNKLVTEK